MHWLRRWLDSKQLTYPQGSAMVRPVRLLKDRDRGGRPIYVHERKLPGDGNEWMRVWFHADFDIIHKEHPLLPGWWIEQAWKKAPEWRERPRVSDWELLRRSDKPCCHQGTSPRQAYFKKHLKRLGEWEKQYGHLVR